MATNPTIELNRNPTSSDTSRVLAIEKGMLWRNTVMGHVFVCVDPGKGKWLKLHDH